MKEVTKAEFFAAVGPRDIITEAVGRSRDELGIFSIFKTRNHIEIGRVYSKPVKQYLLKGAA